MSKNILVIDDDHLVVKSLARLLEREGYSVSGAESGQEALNLIENADFDLIISDVRMPEMNGIETTCNIKDILKEKNKEAIPVIFITGYTSETNYNRAQKLGPTDYIYKPFDKEKFLQSVRSALGS